MKTVRIVQEYISLSHITILSLSFSFSISSFHILVSTFGNKIYITHSFCKRFP